MHHEHQWIGADQADRRQVVERIEAQLLGRGRNGDRPNAAHAERMPIRRGLRHHLGRHDATCACVILHDDAGAADRLLHEFCREARHGIGVAASRERHHQLYRPTWPIVTRDQTAMDMPTRKITISTRSSNWMFQLRWSACGCGAGLAQALQMSRASVSRDNPRRLELCVRQPSQLVIACRCPAIVAACFQPAADLLSRREDPQERPEARAGQPVRGPA